MTRMCYVINAHKLLSAIQSPWRTEKGRRTKDGGQTTLTPPGRIRCSQAESIPSWQIQTDSFGWERCLQGDDPYGRGKSFVDIKLTVPIPLVLKRNFKAAVNKNCSKTIRVTLYRGLTIQNGHPVINLPYLLSGNYYSLLQFLTQFSPFLLCLFMKSQMIRVALMAVSG